VLTNATHLRDWQNKKAAHTVDGLWRSLIVFVVITRAAVPAADSMGHQVCFCTSA
jgi:hypothetical protein